MSKTPCRILVVDDEIDVLTAARIFLKQHFSQVQTESNPNRLPELLQQEAFDVILLDMNFTAGATTSQEGFHWLHQILKHDSQAVVIMITAYGDVELAVRALKEGATDFVMKPWQNEKLLATLTAACKLRQSSLEVKHLINRQKQLNQVIDGQYGEFIGTSAAMKRVYETIAKVAPTDANVLILGENGTGKELVARAIHRQSKRAEEAFIKVDLGAVSETLFESELFGHTKGAFTDAKEDRAGRFEIAAGGTLFLDEIGNLSLPLQAKLLTAIQSRTITRVGSNKMIPVDIRLICATNMPVYDMVQNYQFRQDLLYRVNTVEVQLPPLRERKEDIALLAEHFLSVFAKKYQKTGLRLSTAALQKLREYHWPGNVRELEHAVERAVIMCDRAELLPQDFYFAAPAPAATKTSDFNGTLTDLEKMMVERALQKHIGNITHAAKELGITRTALYRRMEKYGL